MCGLMRFVKVRVLKKLVNACVLNRLVEAICTQETEGKSCFKCSRASQYNYFITNFQFPPFQRTISINATTKYSIRHFYLL